MIAALKDDNDLDHAIRRRMHSCPAFSGANGGESDDRPRKQPSRAISRISISSAPWG